MSQAHRGVWPPEELTRAVREIVRRDGAVRASEALGISRHSVERIAGALPVRRGTISLCEQALARTQTEDARSL